MNRSIIINNNIINININIVLLLILVLLINYYKINKNKDEMKKFFARKK